MFIPMLVLFVFGIIGLVKGVKKIKNGENGSFSLVISLWMLAAAVFLAVPR